ncbi:MAG TPA: glycosyltransferase family 1 protein [Bryobacteraceae bacterium]|nr:glycosyltransferase family 1 protein [Bryobacteraceae bacterium]
MRVCIDAVPLEVRSAGVKNYLYHWITHLRRQAGDGSIGLFPPFGKPGALDHERSVFGRPATFFGLGSLYLANHTRLPVIDWLNGRADVFHATNQIRNPPRKSRLTATIHDMTAWLLPEMHTPGNRLADQRFGDRILRQADGLIAVSAHTKADAVRVLSLDPDRIEVIHSGVASSFFQITPAQAQATAARLGLQRAYILFVGTLEPRKNLDLLLDAYEQLPPGLREEFEMVIAGPTGWAESRTLARLEAGLPGVRRLGYVAEQDLPGLTAGASLFAYPSLYEGFGFPVAQAMACGVAVLTSATSSLPEIAGDGAMLVDPRSVAEVRDGLARLLLSPDLRSRLGACGRAVAERYRWESCAAQSLKFFDQITGRV